MNTKIKTDCEAWKWLIKMGGEFRIHTNKDGLRVFVCLCDMHYTGWTYYYPSRYDNSDWIHAYIHREYKEKAPVGYSGSETGATLKEAVQKHIDQLPGEVHFEEYDEKFEDEIIDDSNYAAWTVEFEGSLKDFMKLDDEDQRPQ